MINLYHKDSSSNAVAKDFYGNELRIGDDIAFWFGENKETATITIGKIFQINEYMRVYKMIIVEDREGRYHTVYKDECAKVVDTFDVGVMEDITEIVSD